MDRYELRHPAVPAELEGATILHLTDFHIRRGHPWPAVVERLAGWLGGHEVDLAVMTGDYADRPPDDGAAAGMLARLVPLIRARRGVYGVFGNHDGPGLMAAVRGLAGVRWLMNDAMSPMPGLELVGASFPEDLVGAAARGGGRGVFRVALVHYPTEVYGAAALGIDVVLAGHTHGGQVRWSPAVTPHTSSDLPSGNASGMYRLGRTVLCVSRGMGEAVARVRVRCPAQAGLFTLRRGEIGEGEGLGVLKRW